MAVKVRKWKGAWWVFIDHRGQRRAKRIGPGKEGRRAANKAAEELNVRLALGDLQVTPDRQDMTLAAYVESWLERNSRGLKTASLVQYRHSLRHDWLPVIGHIGLSKLTRSAIKAFLIQKLTSGLKPTTVRGCSPRCSHA
jgi:hypothetical protein